jgi:lysophospholipase L1-like esterase
MQIKKAMLLIANLLFGCFLLYLFLSDHNQTKLANVETQSIMMNEPIENITEVSSTEEEEQLEADVAEDKPITEEIKEKVREVLEGVFVLFKKDQKIVSIGDSLTQGVGDETKSGGYVGILNHTFEDQNLNITIENYGKRGNRSDQLLKRLDKKEIATSIKEADIVLITIGANDIMNVVKNNWANLHIEPFQTERVEYIKRLTSVFDKINEINPDTKIYLIGFYNPFERYFSDIEQLGIIMNNWNEAGKSVTEEFENVQFIPVQDLFSQSQDNLLAEDHFHPNTSGYKLIAKRVLEYLEDEVDSDDTEVTSENLE